VTTVRADFPTLELLALIAHITATANMTNAWRLSESRLTAPGTSQYAPQFQVLRIEVEQDEEQGDLRIDDEREADEETGSELVRGWR
jgi:hypothetical protein